MALAARHGVRLVAPALMEALPNRHRGLWALAVLDAATIEVGSLHITNATDGKSKIKRQHYVELEAWLQRPVPARLLGVDANHAFDPQWPDLPGATYRLRHDDWDREYAFFSGDNQHGFKDVWFEQLGRVLRGGG